MNSFKTLFIVLLLFFVVGESSAQTPHRRGARRPVVANPAISQPVSQPQPTPSTTTPAIAAPRAPIPMASVNGQIITSAEIDPKVREEVEAVEARIDEARRQLLDLQINTLLLEIEAAKRRITPVKSSR